MSRAGYSDDIGNWELIKWRGQVASAIRGKRGQAFLKELIAALEAMPEKRLISGDLIRGGEVCALGAVGLQRRMPIGLMDANDYEALGEKFGIAHQLVQEIEFQNDEGFYCAQTEDRWKKMHAWATGLLKKEESGK